MSLAACRPDLAAEWHPKKNGALAPDLVGPSSAKKLWWRCSADRAHEWQATVVARNAQGVGCPLCASLAGRSPELAAEWHPRKNGTLRPSDVRPFNNARVWWRCSRDPKHEWQAVIAIRFATGSGCPFCAGRRASASYSLATVHPEPAAEWHPKKNGALSPRDLPPGARCQFAGSWGHPFAGSWGQETERTTGAESAPIRS